MRVYAMVLCLLIGGVTAASAQEAAVGVKGGVNFANVNFDAEGANISFDRRLGFVGGLFVVWPADSRLALQLEALYSQKGVKIDEEGIEGKLELDYLDVPVLLRASSARSGSTAFHAFAGPSIGFRLRARSEGTFEGEFESEDISDETERIDVGVVLGAGVDVGRFTIDARQTWGLSNLNKDTSDDVKFKNRVFSVMAGVRF